MCTITYLPCKSGYIVTQNRDESPNRQEAIFPLRESKGGQKIIYPQDPEGSGSWFVSAQQGVTLCVMNGAYHPNKKPGDYKHSRGLVPFHFLDFQDTKSFLADYHYRELEAFTLLVCATQGVEELIWNEREMEVRSHPAEQLIFQSAPLYNTEQQGFRKSLFNQFMAQNQATDILQFHTQPQTADPTLDILMKRPRVQSVSTVQRSFFKDENKVSYLKKGASKPDYAEF